MRALSCWHDWTSLCRCKGSVFPASMLIALPNAVIAAVLQLMFPDASMTLFGEDGGILTETIVWSGFTFLLGFLVVFRTSQSYARWWEGCSAAHYMRAEWFDSFVTLCTFADHGAATRGQVMYFKQMLVRLGSLLHATALAELEKGGAIEEGREANLFYSYELIGPDDLDQESLDCIRDSECKVEVVYGWVLHHIMDGVAKGVLTAPPPLLTRAFQELGSGLVHYHNAVKLSLSPFPFAYAQTCDGLLLMHWLIVPVVTSQWATHAFWAALFSFVQVFVLSLLNSIAGELANPFGPDTNDVDGTAMQVDMNMLLSMLLQECTDRAPTMNGGWDNVQEEAALGMEASRKSLNTLIGSEKSDSQQQTTMTTKSRRRSVATFFDPVRNLPKAPRSPEHDVPPSPRPPDANTDEGVVVQLPQPCHRNRAPGRRGPGNRDRSEGDGAMEGARSKSPLASGCADLELRVSRSGGCSTAQM